MTGNSNQGEPGSGREQPDTGDDFFCVGAPLHAVRPGYVRRNADDLLYETVIAGRYAHVLEPDRTGKSSLVAATAARLESNGCKIAILDLQQIGVRDGGGADPGRWYYNVAYRLMRQLRIRFDLQSWWQDKSVLSNRQRLVEFYSEVILQSVPERIVVFVDEIQCVEGLPFADQLLASIRAAHNARTTDPDFSRLSFVLLGECDPVNLIEEAEQSPFNITQQVLLGDFTRDELDLFSTELNLSQQDARVALDRVFYWTNGQPYLSQKLARAIAREGSADDIEAFVDRVACQQIAGRAALQNEPHMSHIHRALVNDAKRIEPLLNLYGKVRKGMQVSADLGSPCQRRLIAVGLLVIGDDGDLGVRNRLCERVFTTRWANENLPMRPRVPAVVVAALLLLFLVPFWYTQWLPRPYVGVLTSSSVELETADEAYRNLRSFPLHADIADTLYRSFLTQQAGVAEDEEAILRVAEFAAELPDSGRFPESLEAQYWDRVAFSAKQEERRDDALIAALHSLVLATPQRRQRAANLVGDDYPLLIATLPALGGTSAVFDPVGMVLTSADGGNISQWSYATQSFQRRENWSVTALEVVPLVRRVVIDRQGTVNRVGLTLNISHARLSDLRIKIIAPSGRVLEVKTGLERASSGENIRISPGQLQELIGEPVAGTWSISVRDERLGIAGQFVGWNLKLNSQGNVENFERGLNIPEPAERVTDNIWFDSSGRYAVARAMQSDSARIWDLALAEPLRAIAVNESEALIGLDAGARHLVTATQDNVNLWDTTTGDRIASIAVGSASSDAKLTADGTHLFVARRGDIETTLELWSLETQEKSAAISVAGLPSLIAVDATGGRVAVADYDRAVRIWEFDSGDVEAQVDLPLQPSAISLSADGASLGVVYGNAGVSVWSIARPQQPLLQEFGAGAWQLAFSSSGASVLAGRPETGFQMYASGTGHLVGPPVGLREAGSGAGLLAFSDDEQLILTGAANDRVRVWRAPATGIGSGENFLVKEHRVWQPSGGRVLQATPDAARILIGDPAGHVHVVSAGASVDTINAIDDDVSFVGHNAAVRAIALDRSGAVAASAASDNTIRIWNTESGQPLPYMTEISGPAISRLVFSPDSSLVGVINEDRVSLLETASGNIVAAFELGSPHSGITFTAGDRLYIGGESGSLQLISRDSDGSWTLQEVWQGRAAIRWLEASPRGEFLVLVDADNVASQLVLAEGELAEQVLQLPGLVTDVAFSSVGRRVFFQTSRWVHQASSSFLGLAWQDSVLAPQAAHGASMVASNAAAGAVANRMILPVARNDFVELVELGFRGSSTAGLFGRSNQLLQQWRPRLEGIPVEPEN